MQVWEKFDKTIDTKGLVEDVQAAAENSGEYKEVPFGRYEVELERLELIESKKGNPMVTIWFKILDGEYKKFKLFYNQVITQGFQIHIMNEFLRSLKTGVEIKFENYTQYAKLLDNVYSATYGKLEYGIEYAQTKNGYTTYKITDIFELTNDKPKELLSIEDVDDDCPFDI